jgi:hypothetical protein
LLKGLLGKGVEKEMMPGLKLVQATRRAAADNTAESERRETELDTYR